ncbi:hypothetical protein, partial [Deinococcus sp. 6YEL10]|uniref:hypothetical protein n=1 Tax=Deinococcus sp. 6YEL10 TaxID=2745870 RepID=UPI001E34CC6C
RRPVWPGAGNETLPRTHAPLPFQYESLVHACAPPSPVPVPAACAAPHALTATSRLHAPTARSAPAP